MTQAALHAQVNVDRARSGRPAFVRNSKLDAAAQRLANDMAEMGRPTHTGSDGSTPATRMADVGYRYAAWGENAAETFTAASAECTASWLKSKVGHRETMLGDFFEAGCGVAQAENGRWFWCLLVADPDNSPPPPPKRTDTWLTRLLKKLGWLSVPAWVWASASGALRFTCRAVMPHATNESARWGFSTSDSHLPESEYA